MVSQLKAQQQDFNIHCYHQSMLPHGGLCQVTAKKISTTLTDTAMKNVINFMYSART